MEALIAFILISTVIFMTADASISPSVAAISIGFALDVGVLLGGPVSGGAGNPARALGPMIVAGTFPVWLFYVLGPLVGGALAALSYKALGKATAPKTEEIFALRDLPMDKR